MFAAYSIRQFRVEIICCLAVIVLWVHFRLISEKFKRDAKQMQINSEEQKKKIDELERELEDMKRK